MPFTTPIAWEAVAYYDGRGTAAPTSPTIRSAPARIDSRSTRSSSASCWSATRPGTARAQANAEAPGAVFPDRDRARGRRRGALDAAYAGRRMPFVDRIEFSRERESIPRFNKFLQGYYDDGGIIKESFDAVIQGDRLSPEMEARGMRLDKTVEPSIYYLGFNMDDPGGRHAGRRARPQAAPGDEPGHRHRRVSRAVPQRPRRAGAVAAAARPLRLRRGLPEPVPPASIWRAPGSCWPRPATRTASIPRPAAPAAHLRHLGDHGRGQPAVPVLRRRLAPARPRRRDRRHHLQPVPGQGAARRLPDLHLGLDRRLPRPGELPVPARVQQRALQERRAEHRQLLRRGVRRAVSAR